MNENFDVDEFLEHHGIKVRNGVFVVFKIKTEV